MAKWVISWLLISILNKALYTEFLLSTVVILKPTCCYFWLKSWYKCVYIQTISFRGSFKLCEVSPLAISPFSSHLVECDNKTVVIVFTKWGCSDGNNSWFGSLKSFTMLVKTKTFQFAGKYQMISVQVHSSPAVGYLHGLFCHFITKTAWAHG